MNTSPKHECEAVKLQSSSETQAITRHSQQLGIHTELHIPPEDIIAFFSFFRLFHPLAYHNFL